MNDLIKKHCVSCEGGDPSLPEKKIKDYLQQVSRWQFLKEATAGNEKHPLIRREFQFKDFAGAMKFVNKIADLSESEGHHPDIYIYKWNRLRLDLWTHATGGLHENDFIMAAKIDKLQK